MNAPSTVENLKRKAEDLFSGTPVLFAYLYGSYATGVSHRFSDLDIAVISGEPMDSRQRLDLEMSLALRIDEALGHVVQSDVRDAQTLPLALKGQIVTDGILLYCRDDEARVAFETHTRMVYFDFRRFLDRYRTIRLSAEQVVQEESSVGIH